MLGKLPALGQLWKQPGFVPAVQREGELRAAQGVYQAGAGAACRLPQRPGAASVSGEKNSSVQSCGEQRLVERVDTALDGLW